MIARLSHMLFTCLCAGICGLATAQVPIPAAQDTAPALDWRQRHEPRRATLYSALLPGAGQVYNRKYWKVPIVLGGLGTCIWFVQRNGREMQRYRDAYLAIIDGDPTTVDEFNGQFSADALRGVADQYQRWRDLSYIFTAGVYLLNIVDATVDAHFVRFDVGNDLSLHVQPAPALAAMDAAGVTLSLRLRGHRPGMRIFTP